MSCDLGAVLPTNFFKKIFTTVPVQIKQDEVFKPTKVDETL